MTNDNTTESRLTKEYKRRKVHFHKLFETHLSSASYFSLARSFVALLLVVITLQVLDQEATVVWNYLLIFFTLVFLVLVHYHRLHKRAAARYHSLFRLNSQSVCRVKRDWRELTYEKFSSPEKKSRLYTDLNLIGHGSILHWLNDIQSIRGKKLLLSWLISPVAEKNIIKRQQAVAELASGLDKRHELAILLEMGDAKNQHDDRFLEWAEQEKKSTYLPPRWLVISLVLASFLIIISIVFGALPPLFIIAIFMVNAIVSFKYLPSIHKELDKLGSCEKKFKFYAALIAFIDAADVKSPFLVNIQKRFHQNGGDAEKEISIAQRIIWLADIRHAGVVYLFLQILTLWNLHVYAWLCTWHRDNGTQVRDWLDAITEYEVISSLSGVCYDHPHWCFPVINNDSKKVHAESIGHPLLSLTKQVYNDVFIGEKQKSLLLITGSNMSGKSTLLRSIGTNILLARTGAPVCAEAFVMPNIVLTSCFSSQDSLTDGTSLYMAELKCLKNVMDQTQQATSDGYAPFFLLDEILSGTNSDDRRSATIYLVSQLLSKMGAMGVIATHDIDLARAPELRVFCSPFYFIETIDDNPQGFTMSFDYILRPGVARSANALQLLQIVGLGRVDDIKEKK